MWEAYKDVRELLEVGGVVLVAIYLVALLLWTLILERFWYLFQVHPGRVQGAVLQCERLGDSTSWDSHVIRRLFMSELMMDLDRGVSLIHSLISVCPLLGLLGTTTGMIQVYDVMAIQGGGSPRMMAEGVSQAMVTTMAGLVVALSGIFFAARLENLLADERQRLASRLHIEDELLDHPHRARSGNHPDHREAHESAAGETRGCERPLHLLAEDGAARQGDRARESGGTSRPVPPRIVGGMNCLLATAGRGHPGQ